MVKRYSMVYDPETTLYGMDEEYDGDYVTYDDYHKLEVALKRVADNNGRLEAERDKFRELSAELVKEVERLKEYEWMYKELTE